MNENFCQSCGMPLKAAADYGTNADGSPSTEYCTYCYRDGRYAQEVTMDQMIEHCADYVAEFNRDAGTSFTREEAVVQMRQFFPHLKRWRG